MKKIIIVLIVLILSGCSFQQQPKYDDTYEFGKTVAASYIEMKLGYNPESDYELHRISSTQDYPIIYQVTIDDTAVFCIEFQYGTEISYGGVNFIYNDGYLYTLVRDVNFKEYPEDQYLFSIPFNEDMEYKEYDEVEIQQIEENYDQLVYEEVESILNGGSLDKYISDADWTFQEGDTLTLKAPIRHFNIVLDKERKVIQIIQRGKYDYPVYINDELKIVFSASIDEDGFISGFGFRGIEEYPDLLNTNQQFVRVTTGSFYFQSYFVTKDSLLSSEIPHPLYVDMVLDEIQGLIE